ncbi:hypothetical protein K7432_013628 [Basidiobolus ranarum]
MEESGSKQHNDEPTHNSSHAIHTSLFQIRYTTTVLNGPFRKAAAFVPNFWKNWFTIGVCFGLAAMIFGFGLVLLAGWRISLILCQSWLDHTGNTGELPINGPSDHSGQLIIPMIPGVTLPLSHVAYYLVALLLSGIVHEVGHSIAAMSERVPVHSFGVFVIFLYPGAFVAVSSRHLARLYPFRKLRVICAGVWHNAVLFLIVWCLLSSGAMNFCFSLVGWAELHPNDGVAVVNVAADSPLNAFLSQSSLIIGLNDQPLSDGLDSWNQILLGTVLENAPEHRKGFCASQPEIEVEPLECCDISQQYPFGQSHNESISCFTTLVPLGEQLEEDIGSKYACLPSIKTVTQNQRCKIDTDCDFYHQDGFTSGNCMVPFSPQPNVRLLRMFFREPEWNTGSKVAQSDKMVVFLGDYAEVWNTVQVSILKPRWWFVPASLPLMIESVLRYILSFTLALSILNILPAYHLDGHHALSAILSILFSSSEQNNNGMVQLRKAMEKSILIVTSILIGWVIIGSLVLTLLGLH